LVVGLAEKVEIDVGGKICVSHTTNAMKTKVRIGGDLIGRAVSAGTILLLGATMNTQAIYNYVTFGVPGANATYAYGISGNNIVGQYNTASGVYGFLFNGGSYTTLSVPGATGTFAYDIDDNSIVGAYDAANGNEYGFLYNTISQTYTTLSVPGAYNTWAAGISGNNIVGACADTNGAHGFLYNGRSYTTFNVPGTTSTDAWGIDGNNVVGYYYDAAIGNDRGFLYNGSSYTTLLMPGGRWTYAYDISGNNIVGYYGGSFLYNTITQTYTTLSVPGPGITAAHGIDGDNIVGTYYTDSGPYGFLATTGAVPEPAALALLAVGAAAIFVCRRSHR
jgi:hypothetical protein